MYSVLTCHKLIASDVPTLLALLVLCQSLLLQSRISKTPAQGRCYSGADSCSWCLPACLPACLLSCLSNCLTTGWDRCRKDSMLFKARDSEAVLAHQLSLYLWDRARHWPWATTATAGKPCDKTRKLAPLQAFTPESANGEKATLCVLSTPGCHSCLSAWNL